jgi:hypothetical protein
MTNNFSWTILDFDSTPKLQSAELLPYDINNHYNADCYTSQGDLIAHFDDIKVEISSLGDLSFHLKYCIFKKKCFHLDSSVIFHIDFWLYSKKNNSYARFWLINCTLSSAMYNSGKLMNCGGNAEIIKKWNDFVPGLVSCIRF